MPLSVARWHAHVNICPPPRDQKERWLEARGGEPLFGPRGVIATEAACAKEGGRFFPQLFGWMVHVNLASGDDPAAIWSTAHVAHHQAHH